MLAIIICAAAGLLIRNNNRTSGFFFGGLVGVAFFAGGALFNPNAAPCPSKAHGLENLISMPMRCR